MTRAYLYFMKDEAAPVREVAPHHALYWSETGSAEGGGPCGDRSGGLIIFDAADEGAAGQVVADDPFQREALLRAVVDESVGAPQKTYADPTFRLSEQTAIQREH
jgi:hypothetical protein